MTITSGGTSRKFSSKAPISTTGHSTRPATSFSSAFVLDQFEALRESEIACFGADGLGAARGIDDDVRVMELLRIVLEAARR